MKRRFPNVGVPIIFLLCGLFLASCSVMSKDIRMDAEKDISFEFLKQNTDQYEGKTVILGGYILEIRNFREETRLLVLQAPLAIRDQPRDRDLSEGRFMVVLGGFLDPAVYEKGRKITIAGEVLGHESVRIDGHMYDMPLLRAREVYLWQVPRESIGCCYYDDPFYPWPDSYLRYRPYPLFHW